METYQLVGFVQTSDTMRNWKPYDEGRTLWVRKCPSLTLGPCLSLRWLVFPAGVQGLLCYRAVVVSDRSSGALLLHTVTEWAHRHLMAPLTTRHPSDTTPPTSTLSTAVCSPSACRTEEGKEVCMFVCTQYISRITELQCHTAL